MSAAACQKILDAAEYVFCAKGLSHRRIEDIALHANMTCGEVYWHYRDKNEL
jgi:TetR/AcrR family acrAB operon transcriptional repressor